MTGSLSFPGDLDTFPEIGADDFLDDPDKDHAGIHNLAFAAIRALEAKVGIDSSADPTSLDYKVGLLVAGINAFTSVATDFTQPAAAANVTVILQTTAFLAPGQIIYIANGGYYTVASIADLTHITATNTGYPGNAVAGSTVGAGSAAVPAGIRGAQGIQGDTGADAPSVSRVTGTFAAPSSTQVLSTLALAKVFRALRVVASAPCRLRLYATAAERNADASRPATTFPSATAGLIAEWVFDASHLSIDCAPVVHGANMESTPSNAIAFAMDGQTGAANVVLTYQAVEA